MWANNKQRNSTPCPKCKLNIKWMTTNLQLVLKKLVCLRNSVKYPQQSHWSLYFFSIHLLWLVSARSCTLAVWRHLCLINQRVAQLIHLFWPQYKFCNQNLAWKYSKWCWTSVECERSGLASWYTYQTTCMTWDEMQTENVCILILNSEHNKILGFYCLSIYYYWNRFKILN